MSLRNTAVAIVLAIIFSSLVTIYLVTFQDPLVTGLSVVIMALCLTIAVIGGWRETGILAGFAALVSLVAINLYGQARFGNVGGILLPIVWGMLLFIAFAWVSRNVLRVPEDNAVLILNTYTGSPPYRAASPIARPILPLIERRYATIPLYELTDEITIKAINTPGGYNVNSVQVDVSYRVDDTTQLLKGLPNRAEIESTIAREMGQNVDDARTSIAFWEKLLKRQMQAEVDGIVREVIFFADERGPVKVYEARNRLSERVQEKLRAQAARWGVHINRVELEHFDVSPDRFRSANMPNIIKSETELEQIKAEREATRIRLVREAQTEQETERVKRLVEALREANIDLKPEILRELVISAIRESYEIEGDYLRLLPEPTLPTKPAGDKK